MFRKVLLVAVGGLLVAGCGSPGATVAPLQGQQAGEDKIEAETYGLISRWLLDRNYMVTNVQRFKQGRPAPKVAVRGIFWSTYRTKRGFLFRDGYWNLSLRDESDAMAMGSGNTGRGRYDQSYGPSYNHYSGRAAGMFGDYGMYDDTLYDDYDEDYTDDCMDPSGAGYGSNYGSYNSYSGRGRKRRNTGRGYDDGMDCYPGSGNGSPGNGSPGYGSPGYGSPGYGSPGYGSPGYGSPGYGSPGYGSPGSDYGNPGYGTPGSPYRSPYNTYRGPQIQIVRVQDNSKSNNFKVFNGERAIAFIDGDKMKEVRLVRDGSTIWKTMF